MFVTDWAVFWSAASAIATAIAAIIAILAMLRWRKQDELKAKMAFKLAIADYKYFLMQMPSSLNSEDLRKEFQGEEKKLDDLLSACNNAWIATEDLLHSNKKVLSWWESILKTHRKYLNGSTEAEELLVYCDGILTLKFIF